METVIRQCPQCGSENRRDDAFCTHCGLRLPLEAVEAEGGLKPARFLTPLAGLFVGLIFALILLQVTQLSAETHLGEGSSPSDVAALQESLDELPSVVLFWPFSSGVESLWTRDSATSLAWDRFPATLVIMILGGGLAVLLAWVLGLGLRRRHPASSAGRMTIASLAAMPVFWLGLLIFLVLLHGFDWLPPLGYEDFWDDPKDNIVQLIWPIIAIGFIGGLWTALQMRSNEETSSGLVLAHALGLVLRHGGMLLAGTLLLEVLFLVPGLGRILLESFYQRDTAVLGVAAAIIIWFALLSRLFGNLLLAAVDGLSPGRTEVFRAKESVPALAIGAGVTLGLLALLLLAPFLAPEDPNSLQERFTGPSAAHWFGTDQLGRDIFSRVLHGGRTAALIGLPMGLMALLLGFPMVLARVLLDRAGMPQLVYGIEGALEGLVAVPWLVIAILVQASSGPGWPFLALAVILIPRALRVGWSMGAGERLQAVDLASVALRLGALFFAGSLAMSTALGYLGIGVSPPRTDLGMVLIDGGQYIESAYWAVVFPGLSLTLIAVVWLGVATLFSRRGTEYRPVGWAHTIS